MIPASVLKHDLISQSRNCPLVEVSCGPLNERLKDLYGRLSEVLHARRAVGIADVREVLGETLLVIEELYESHGF